MSHTDVTELMKAEDLIKMSIQCPELNFPIALPFTQVQHLSVDLLLSEIERVLQSYQQFVLDDGFTMDILHVTMSKGSGRNPRSTQEV